MKLSEQGFNLLVEREAIMLMPYRDSVGLWTIGVGHLLTRMERTTGLIKIAGKSFRWRKGLTREQVLALFNQDIARFEHAVNSRVSYPLKQHQYDALVSFSFNVGIRNFSRSTLVRKLNAGDVEGAAKREFPRWKIPPAVISRRAGEQAQFIGSHFVAREKRGFVYV